MIVYTTVISQATINAYESYKKAKQKYGSGPKVNAAFIEFSNLCEKENKQPLSVIESLNK